MPILRKYNIQEINLLIEDVLKRFRHHNIVSDPQNLGVQEVNEISYIIRIICKTKSFEHFEITRLLKTFLIKKLNEHGISGFEIV